MCQYRFTSCNKRPSWSGLLLMEEAMHVCGKGVYGNSLYLPLHFAVNPKTSLKNKILKKKNKITSQYTGVGIGSGYLVVTICDNC